MLQTIPQVKELRMRTQDGGAFSPGQGAGLQLLLRLERPEGRLEAHAQNAFPDCRLESAHTPKGYLLWLGKSGRREPVLKPDTLSSLEGRPEGYVLTVEAAGVEIQALDAAGLFYGLQTLRQWAGRYPVIPAVTVADWPDTACRCMNFDLRQTYSRPERLVEYLKEFACWKINAVLIEYEDKFPFDLHPELRHPRHALTAAQFEALRRTARDYFIEIIPLQQSFGHLEYVLRHDRYKGLRETAESTGELCPSRPESLTLVTELLQEMMDRHPDSRYIHLGCDEVYSLCECELCRERYEGSRERAFIAFLNKLIDYAASRGKTPIFWHDMLDKCPEEELQRLDKRGVAMIWIYNGRNIEAEVSALTERFRRHGIRVMGAPAVRCFDWREQQNYPVIHNRVDNLAQWSRTADKLELDCLVATNWTGAFSLGVPYGIFETTWYLMGLHADLCWNRDADIAGYIDRFLSLFHGIEAAASRRRLGNYTTEDYYEIIWRLEDEVRLNKDYARLIAVMHDFEVATDKSRAIHKYVYRWELFPGDEAEWRSLENNYRRNTAGLNRVRPEMTAILNKFQPEDMAEHYVLSRFYLHDYLERTIYRDIGLSMPPASSTETAKG